MRNVCALPRKQAEAILAEIRASSNPRLKPGYLKRRLATERWLLAERTEKLGPPPLKHPLYFFLGDYADGLDSSRSASLVIPLAALPPASLTFTYLDSMASLSLGTLEAHRAEHMPYHGKVFTRGEIEGVIAEFGLPEAAEETATLRRPFIEVQVWDDGPLRVFLADQCSAMPQISRERAG